MTVGTSASNAGTVELGEHAVNRLGFGAMRITGRGVWGEPADPAGMRLLLQRAVELGVNFIDTAHAYGPEVSERLIAEALHPYPTGLLITTKSGQQRGGPDNWYPDGRPETLRRELERSLQLLRVERIDLFQLHRPDPGVPLQESVGELTRLQEQGKIGSIGVSNVSLAELRSAQEVAEIVSVQNRYSIFDRASEDILAYCEENAIVFIPWSPLGAGSTTHSRLLAELADSHAISQAQLALAWLLHHSPSILLIPGTSSLAHLEENIAAGAIGLPPEMLHRLDELPR